MYFIIFCCIAACSFDGGGIDIFCVTSMIATVMIGKIFRYGPSGPWTRNVGIKDDQLRNMSGAARSEHQRIPDQNSGDCRNSTSTMSDRYKPINMGICK